MQLVELIELYAVATILWCSVLVFMIWLYFRMQGTDKALKTITSTELEE